MTRLKTYHVSSQQYGAFFSGFEWQIFGCGTFRHQVSAEVAEASMRGFLSRLERSLGDCPVASIAVLERRISGCGSSGTHLHWHFLAAAPCQYQSLMFKGALSIWSTHYGDAKIDIYDSRRPGAHYMAKTAALGDFNYLIHNLFRLRYFGPEDIPSAIREDPYVPQHAKNMVFGSTLRLASSDSIF
jgi:hypothetical protein